MFCVKVSGFQPLTFQKSSAWGVCLGSECTSETCQESETNTWVDIQSGQEKPCQNKSDDLQKIRHWHDSKLWLLFSFVVLTRSDRSRSGIWAEYCTIHMETKILGMNQINLWKTFLKIITVIWSV